ncbi:MAG: DUF2141 domain-containing protein [Gammaproteobacteria bacterium]|nr:DUF2141 domain-containing protein [Gammaproteobacteria bacterium]
MKFLVTIAISLTCSATLAADLTIKITNVEETTGTIYIAIWKDETNWPAGEPWRGYTTAVQAPETNYTLDIEEGIYAVSVFQDLNGNAKLDRNAIGLPREPYGISNDAPARFGPPKWQKMTFRVGAEGYTAELKLR